MVPPVHSPWVWLQGGDDRMWRKLDGTKNIKGGREDDHMIHSKNRFLIHIYVNRGKICIMAL